VLIIHSLRSLVVFKLSYRSYHSQNPNALHKFILNLATNIRQPINTQPDVQRLTGHCRLSVINDGKVCIDLTKTYYHQDLGACSLANAVKEVEYEFSTEYGNTDEEVTEDINCGPLQHFVVQRIPVSYDAYEVTVCRHENGEALELEDEQGLNATDVDDELGTWSPA